jgi:hypothetical protein
VSPPSPGTGGANSASGVRAYYGAEKVGAPPLRDDGSSSESVLDSGTAITFIVLLLRRKIGLTGPADGNKKGHSTGCGLALGRQGLHPAVPLPTAGRAVLSRPEFDCQRGSSTQRRPSLYGDDCHHCQKPSTSSYSINYQRFCLPPCSDRTKTLAIADNVARAGENVNFMPATSPRPAGFLALIRRTSLLVSALIPPLRAYRYISGILDIGIEI